MDPHEYRIKIEPEDFELIKNHNPKDILEVFSGNGKNLNFFHNNFKDSNITGIESEQNYIDESLTNFPKLRNSENNPKINIIKHKIFLDSLPFEENQFDFIYSYQYINHNYKDQIIILLQNIYKILKQDGLFSLKISDIDQFNLKKISDEPNDPFYIEQDEEFPKIRYRKLTSQTFAKLETNEIWIPHYAFHIDELKFDLEKIGFKIINIRTIKWNIVANCTK